MKKLFLFLMGLVMLSPAFSQQIPNGDGVKDMLGEFFKGMKNKDSVTLQQAFHVDAVMQTVVKEDGWLRLVTSDVGDFLKRVETSAAELDERMLSCEVNVDGGMAHAWVPYEFYVDGTFSHCGVNSFQLIHTGETWQIAHVLDTRSTEGCK